MNSQDAAKAFLLNAQSGDLDGVRLYLNNGGDPNFSGQPRRITALLLAVKEGHIEVVKELLEKGADINCRTERGLSCVHAVAMTGDEKMFHMLLEYGLRDMDLTWMPSAYSPSVYTPLYMAAQENNTRVMEMMMVHGADPLREIQVEPGPIKLKACEVALNLGNSEAVNLFVLWCHRLGPFSVDKVRELPAHNPESANILRAAIMDKLENLAVIAQKKEVDNLSVIKDTSLKEFLEAAQSGDVDVLSSIAESQSVSATAPMGLSALHMACLKGKMDSINFLLSHGACVNLQSEAGFTPLYFAAQEGHEEVVRLLLKAGADPCLGLKCGLAPLGIALSMHHRVIASTILAQCPSAPAVSCLDTKYINKQPDKLLLRAAEKGNLDEVKYCIDDIGMDPNKVTSLLGIKAVHFACQRGHASILNELLSRNASINCRTKKGYEALHCAAFGGHLDILGILLNHGAKVNCQTENGATPLYVACQLNHAAFAEMLLLSGADPLMEITGEHPLSCVDVARANTSVDVLNLLLYWSSRVGPFKCLSSNTDETSAYSEDRAEEVQSNILSRIGEVAMSQQIEEFDLMQKMSNENAQRPLEEALRGNTAFFDQTQPMSLQTSVPAAGLLTPLHCASFGGHIDTVEHLLQCRVDANKQTKSGFTPLYLAAQQGHLEVVETLIQSGADPTVFSKIGLTAVGIAMYTRQRHVVVTILNHTPNLQPIHPAGAYCKKALKADKKKGGCVVS